MQIVWLSYYSIFMRVVSNFLKQIRICLFGREFSFVINLIIYLFKNFVIKKLLEFFIVVIDVKLFKVVEFIIFCIKGK